MHLQQRCWLGEANERFESACPTVESDQTHIFGFPMASTTVKLWLGDLRHLRLLRACARVLKSNRRQPTVDDFVVFQIRDILRFATTEAIPAAPKAIIMLATIQGSARNAHWPKGGVSAA